VGAGFWRLFGGCTTTYGDLCWPAGLEATRLTLGENKHNAPWDLEHARLIVLWGKNPAETNIHQGVFIERALRRGARLVVIDPRRTQSAEQAELFIQPRPGTDGAIALAVAHLLIERGAIDEEFIAAHVLGYPEFAASIAHCSAEWAAGFSEVSTGQIEALADLFAGHAPISINGGFGMQRYSNSGQTMRAIIALLVMTGNIGKRGAGWVFANLQSHVFDLVQDPLAFFPPDEPDGVTRVSVSTSRLGQDMLSQNDPPLKFLWVERGNPVTQNPDTNRVLEAFRALDFRVVVEQFLTDTAREADIVLPAKSMFEQTDVINAYWHSYLQLKQKVIEPPGEVKPESEIYWELGQRLGIGVEALRDVMPGPGDEAVDDFLRAHLKPLQGVTLEELREGPVLVPGHEEIVFADGVFATPSGRIELRSEEAARRWGVDALPDYSEPVEGTRGSRDEAREWLSFMTPNTKNRIHSQFNNLESIRVMSPAPFLQMHPDDAAHRGLQDGARARIVNDRGELEAPVQLDWGIKPGCVAMTNGWWISQGGTVNFCSLGRETDMGHGAAFHENLVRVEKA
jgi:anaerobic selenocysteine-containing dehydrogenase